MENTNTSTIERPTWNEHMDKRALVWLDRDRSAYDAAERRYGFVTDETMEEANAVLMRATRWALAQMRFDESETESNQHSRARAAKAAQLDRRYERISKELEPYGLEIECLGYFCQNVYDEQGRSYLHFFD